MKQSTMEVFAEVDTILGYMDNTYVQQIPEKLRKLFKEKKAKDYIKIINPTIPLQNQNLKRDTLLILAVLNYNYWCTDQDEKRRLLQKYNENEERYQKILRKVYNPDTIFKRKMPMQSNQAIHRELIEKKENIIKKLFDKIKNFFTSAIKIDPNNIWEIRDINGNKRKIIVLLYFTLKTDKNDYIVYTNSLNKKKGTVYSSKVVIHENEITLENITDNNTINEITEIIKELRFKNNISEEDNETRKTT